MLISVIAPNGRRGVKMHVRARPRCPVVCSLASSEGSARNRVFITHSSRPGIEDSDVARIRRGQAATTAEVARPTKPGLVACGPPWRMTPWLLSSNRWLPRGTPLPY